MKLLVLSDTHNSLYYGKMVIQRIKDRIDMIIHLGDHDEDAIELMRHFPDIPFHYVGGNCDFGSSPKEKLITVGTKKIFMTHGHRYNVKWGYDRISYCGEEKGADIVLFGHTHIPVIEYYHNMLLLNPGSMSQPRGTTIPTFGVIEIDKNGRVEPCIMGVENNNEFNRLNII